LRGTGRGALPNVEAPHSQKPVERRRLGLDASLQMGLGLPGMNNGNRRITEAGSATLSGSAARYVHYFVYLCWLGCMLFALAYIYVLLGWAGSIVASVRQGIWVLWCMGPVPPRIAYVGLGWLLAFIMQLSIEAWVHGCCKYSREIYKSFGEAGQ